MIPIHLSNGISICLYISALIQKTTVLVVYGMFKAFQSFKQDMYLRNQSFSPKKQRTEVDKSHIIVVCYLKIRILARIANLNTLFSQDKIERSPLKRNKVSTKTNSKEEMIPDNNDKIEVPKLSIKFKITAKNQSNKRYLQILYFLTTSKINLKLYFLTNIK